MLDPAPTPTPIATHTARTNPHDPFASIKDVEACLQFNRLLLRQAAVLQDQLESEHAIAQTVRASSCSRSAHTRLEQVGPYTTGRVKE